MVSTRQMKLLYYLTQAGGCVTARELAEYAGVSERTVKTDLIEVKVLAEEAGSELLSQKGKGYWIQIRDKNLFEKLEEKLYSHFSHFNYTQEYQERANRIVRILLVSEEYIKLDDIAERLYLSRSSLKGAMQDAREILEGFKLELVSKPGYGIKVNGAEINIRFCMLELFLDHDYRKIPNIQEEEYLAYFKLNQVDIGELRQHFLKVLRESGTRIVDNNTHRLVRYFFLMYNRYQKGYHMEFSEADSCFLREMREYLTAVDILKELQQKDTGISVDETEVFGLELLLLLWNDLNEYDELAVRYPLFYQKSSDLARKITNQIQMQWGIDFNKLEGMSQNLISAMIPNYTKIHFSFLGYNRTIGKKVENNMMSSSPVSIALALTTAAVIEKEYGLRLSRADIFHYAVRFYIAIERIKYEYVPRKILISAQSGIQSCVIIRDKMLMHFGAEAFERLEIINSYEIRRLNQSDYDYMILNFAPYYYRYQLPVIYVDSIPDEKQMNQIYHQAVLSGYQIRGLQDSFCFDGDFVFRDFPYEGRESFINLLCYKYCSSKYVHDMKAQLMQYTDICVWNGVAAIVTDSSLTGKNQFLLFCLENTGVWEKKTIKYILFVAVNYMGNGRVMKFLEQLSHELIHNPENLEKLADTKSVNQFQEIVKHGLTLGQ